MAELTGLVCTRCLDRKLKQPRRAITIWWGDALCKQCLELRQASRYLEKGRHANA